MIRAENDKWRKVVNLVNEEKIKTLKEKENCKYLEILEVDTIKQAEMKEKNNDEYLRRTSKKLLEIKLCGSNDIKGINTTTVPLVRYSGISLKWTREELQEIVQRNKKTYDDAQVLTSERWFRLYKSGKEEGRGFNRIQDSFDT